MIVGVPTSDELHSTAVGWLNLAWEIAIRDLSNSQDIEEYQSTMEVEDQTKVEAPAAKIWSYELNNAISLLQQSLEIELKARIAEVSPFLLIAGDPQSWPKPDKHGQVDFSDFRTLDSVQLCRTCNVVSDRPLPPQFVTLYGNVRKARNKIAHLSAANVRASSGEIVRMILTAHGLLYGKGTWLEFRRRHLTIEAQPSEVYPDYEDSTNDTLNHEFSSLLSELQPSELREFFGFDSRKSGLTCFNCLDQRTQWCDVHWDFAQKQKDGAVKCVVCQHLYASAEYKELADEAARELAESKRLYGAETLADAASATRLRGRQDD